MFLEEKRNTKGSEMTKNIHFIERSLRVTVGLFLMSLAFWGPTSYWLLLGIFPVVTGFVGLCPFYSILGFSTCNRVA
jgi:hypothetical protein